MQDGEEIKVKSWSEAKGVVGGARGERVGSGLVDRKGMSKQASVKNGMQLPLA